MNLFNPLPQFIYTYDIVTESQGERGGENTLIGDFN